MIRLLTVSLAWLSGVGWPASDTVDVRLRSAILRAEDARPRTAEDLAPILAGLRSRDSVARRIAVRALGRQERGELIETITPLLQDPADGVRAEAANALAQSAAPGRMEEARRRLEDRLELETHPMVRGAIFRSLGRLRLVRDADAAAIERLLLRGSSDPGGGDAPLAALEGVTHGLGSLYRRTASRMLASGSAIERLIQLTSSSQSVTVRRQAMTALVATGRADSAALLDALDDPDWQVRRLALVAARAQDDLPGRERITRSAWTDPEPAVRYEALQSQGNRQPGRDGCEAVFRALADPSAHVRLAAIDVLGQCGAPTASTLRDLARQPFDAESWHVPAHALVALAQAAQPMADSILPAFVEHPVWWARMYAARAAHAAARVPVLEQLAQDPVPNVRQAALIGLHGLRGHAADLFYLQALESDDPQLLLTAAQMLDSTPSPDQAIPALLGALQRVTAERRATSRDPRNALLGTLATIAGAAQANALRAYLEDFDPAIAERAAEILTRWTGTVHRASPRPLPPTPVPTWEELERLADLRPVLLMRGGGRIVLRLRPFDAPTNTARFVGMARAGWFNGLSFHRVAPNYVVQGGSPGANEYVGDGSYTRDELGLVSHRRGTVGVSTRGRDTGDGQIFINLVDNIRLDHEYTIFAEVIEGMEAVDALLEGAVIERVAIEGGNQ